MKLPGSNELLSYPAAMFYCTAASSLCVTVTEEMHTEFMREVKFAATFCHLLFPSLIALWILRDAAKRGLRQHYDAGSFYYFAWPFLAPIYVLSTRGWRGFATLGWFALQQFVALLIGNIPYFVAKLPE
jgi:hypothetical protein